MTDLRTAVVVASWRRPDALVRCIDGLRDQTRAPDEVLVALRTDDGESRSAMSSVSWEPLRVVPVRRAGAVAARNAGIANASAEVIAFVDDDAVPKPDWLELLVGHYADPRVGAVGGRDLVYHDGVREEGAEQVVGRVLPYGRFVGFHHLGHGEPRDVELLKGANMSVRASALAGRGFDTELRGEGAEHHEDWTLCLRIRRAGWKVVYDPAVQVHHFETPRADRTAPSGAALRDRVHNQTYAAVRYLPWPRAAAHVGFALAVGTTVGPGLGKALVRLREPGIWSAFLETMRGRLAGVITGLAGRSADRGRVVCAPAP